MLELDTESWGEDLPRAEGRPSNVRRLEELLSRGEQHNGGYREVVDTWHAMLPDQRVSTNYLNRMAFRAGVIDEGDRYLAQREDL